MTVHSPVNLNNLEDPCKRMIKHINEISDIDYPSYIAALRYLAIDSYSKEAYTIRHDLFRWVILPTGEVICSPDPVAPTFPAFETKEDIINALEITKPAYTKVFGFEPYECKTD